MRNLRKEKKSGTRLRAAAMTLFLGAALTGVFVPAVADTLEDQLADIDSRISSARDEAASAQEIIDAVRVKLDAIKKELDAAGAELERIHKEQAALARSIAETEAELARAEEALAERQDILAKRVRAIYMHGSLNYLDVIFGSKSFSDFTNRLELLKRILRADFTLISEIRERQAAIEAKKAEIEEKKRGLDALEAEAAAVQAAIDAKRAEEQAALDAAREHKAAAEQMERDLQAASADIREKIRARLRRKESGAESAAPVTGTGQFAWPCEGPITSDFGYRIHPIFGTRIFHSGIDIGVDYGTPIRAADSGTVIYADWIEGYGNAVIIDHGNGLQTIYGHNQELAVSEGQTVSKGTLIAYAGATGYATGPHLHFEVRLNGEVVSPWNYL